MKYEEIIIIPVSTTHSIISFYNFDHLLSSGSFLAISWDISASFIHNVRHMVLRSVV